MTAEPPPTHLATEFFRKPFGRHSEDLQSLLHAMRAAPILNKHFLFMAQTNNEWVLGRNLTDSPPDPRLDWSTAFSDLEEAERHVFRVRWAEMFGEPIAEQIGTPAAASAFVDDETSRKRLERSPSVLAYANARSVRAGEPITFFVSSEDGAPYDAAIVRLLAPDLGPLGPPRREHTIGASIDGRYEGQAQKIRIGSFAHVPGPIPLASEISLQILVFPTLTEDRTATIAEVTGSSGLKLRVVQSTSGLVAELALGSSTHVASLPPLQDRIWTRISVGCDLANGRLTLSADPLATAGALPPPDQAVAVSFGETTESFESSSLTLAASLDEEGRHHAPNTCFNGKLEAPILWASGNGSSDPLCAWDFSLEIPTAIIRDTGKLGLHGVLHNLPTRGTRGSRWTGDHLTWMAAPDAYAAIHFHDTDLSDAGWQPSLTYEVPVDSPSGCYALRVRPADDATPEFYVPFVVRPAAGAPTKDIAFVLPTTTYGAYSNMHLRITAQFNELLHGRLTVLDSTDLLLLRKPELGRSTYDVHRDGSPVVYSSMNRPVTNFRPTGRMYKFCLDLMIVDWLDSCGYEFDVITDDDIDLEGSAAMAPYRVLLTGSHPEYITRRQFDAFETFLASGGRLMYLGGNGFYAAAEILPERRDVVEVRRPGQDNMWRVNHAEAASSASGLPTGLWRNIGRPENTLTGVGFITQGFDECRHYTRTPASDDPRASWVFNGLDRNEVIGDFGILQGGAAGYEVDRHEITKGSPTHSLVLASSSGHSNLYELLMPSILDTLPDPNRTDSPIRADMVFFETPQGGAVFSVGSIAWAGSLSHNNYDNNVSQVTRNVLNRFASPTPFEAPPR